MRAAERTGGCSQPKHHTQHTWHSRGARDTRGTRCMQCTQGTRDTRGSRGTHGTHGAHTAHMGYTRHTHRAHMAHSAHDTHSAHGTHGAHVCGSDSVSPASVSNQVAESLRPSLSPRTRATEPGEPVKGPALHTDGLPSVPLTLKFKLALKLTFLNIDVTTRAVKTRACAAQT